MNPTPHYQTAIIGAGFCGTMVAVHIARLAPQMAIALIERGPVAGPGLAYGTEDPGHLLNVRVNQIGAYADDPDHFARWIHNDHSALNTTPQSFVPRRIFGDYVKQILKQSRAANPNVALINRAITNIRRLPNGGFELTGNNGLVLTADKVVLALGNFPPGQVSNSAVAMNPYEPETWRALADDGDVLIIGTGLTSLDLIITLAKTKPKGTLHLLSRHGLLPHEHVDAPSHKLALKPPHPATALGLLRTVRKEIRDAPGVAWQSVIDSLRPTNQELWQSLNPDEQRRFLRHLRIYWDVHRHRCAPQILDVYQTLRQEGRIALHKGSLVKQNPNAAGWDIVWRPRGASNHGNLSVKHVVNCAGPQTDIGKMQDQLIHNLLKNDLIAADRLRLGIVTAEDYTVCNSQGNRVEGLYALGSILKGKFYETVAVRELRIQAADVAGLIVRRMQFGGPI